MHIAIYEIDEKGRKILKGWEAYRTQEPGNLIEPGSTWCYADLILEQPLMPPGRFEITSLGLLPLDPFDEMTPSVLKAYKQTKIKLLNDQFAHIIEDTASVDYLLYLFMQYLKNGLDISDLIIWMDELNSSRNKLIHEIHEKENQEDIDAVQYSHSNLFIRPALPEFDQTLMDSSLNINRSSTHRMKVGLNAGGKLDIPLNTNRPPIICSLLNDYQELLEVSWDNSQSEQIVVRPSSMIHRLLDGTSHGSALNMMEQSVVLPDELNRIEVNIKDTDLTVTTLHLTTDSDDCTTTIIAPSKVHQLKGRYLTFNIDEICSTLIIQTDSLNLGPLHIQGTKVDFGTVIREQNLPEGSLSIKFNNSHTTYKVVDQEQNIKYEGRGPKDIDELVVNEDDILLVEFLPSSSKVRVDWILDPAAPSYESFNLPFKYNKKLDRISVINDRDEALFGTIVLIHE